MFLRLQLTEHASCCSREGACMHDSMLSQGLVLGHDDRTCQNVSMLGKL